MTRRKGLNASLKNNRNQPLWEKRLLWSRILGQSLESTAIVMSQTNVFSNCVALLCSKSQSCLVLSPCLGHSRIPQNWQSHQPIHTDAEVVPQRKYRCSYQKREWIPSRKIQVRQDKNIETLHINDYPSFISYWWVIENQALTSSYLVLSSISMCSHEELPFHLSEISVPNAYDIQAARIDEFCAPDATLLSFSGWWGWTKKNPV